MLRGNERRSVFLDEKDKNRFIEIMLQKKEAAASRLFAFCVIGLSRLRQPKGVTGTVPLTHIFCPWYNIPG